MRKQTVTFLILILALASMFTATIVGASMIIKENYIALLLDGIFGAVLNRTTALSN
jgi:hypothetical protein